MYNYRRMLGNIIIDHAKKVYMNQLGCLGGSVGRATALKAGGRRFESHLSSLFFYENRKEGSQVCFFALPLKSKVHMKIQN